MPFWGYLTEGIYEYVNLTELYLNWENLRLNWRLLSLAERGAEMQFRTYRGIPALVERTEEDRAGIISWYRWSLVSTSYITGGVGYKMQDCSPARAVCNSCGRVDESRSRSGGLSNLGGAERVAAKLLLCETIFLYLSF